MRFARRGRVGKRRRNPHAHRRFIPHAVDGDISSVYGLAEHLHHRGQLQIRRSKAHIVALAAALLHHAFERIRVAQKLNRRRNLAIAQKKADARSGDGTPIEAFQIMRANTRSTRIAPLMQLGNSTCRFRAKTEIGAHMHRIRCASTERRIHESHRRLGGKCRGER